MIRIENNELDNNMTLFIENKEMFTIKENTKKILISYYKNQILVTLVNA